MNLQPDPIEAVLAAIDWGVGSRRRLRLSPGERVAIDPGVAQLGFIVSGRVADTSGRHCLDLPAGGAFVSMGRKATGIRAETSAELMLAELTPMSHSPTAIDLMPALLAVSSFASIEPNIAAIARSIGDPPDGTHRAADGRICSLMVTTVVLGAIRAWAEVGCAPDGWPARAADPFLARVLDAIHEEPGRSWSVDTLAAVGAMSRTVFADRFRAAMGKTPAAYLGDVRIEAAKPILAAGGSVSDTARQLGYASDEGFSRAFRRRTGVPPSRWRQRGTRRLLAETNSTVPMPTRVPATT